MERNIFRKTETEQPKQMVVKTKGIALPSLLSDTMQKPGLATTKKMKEMAKGAAIEAIHEQCRALLTKSAMDNVVALSLLETHLGDMIPNSQARLKLIVDTYTATTAERLMRW
jgi:hypothetical protein